MGYSAAGHPDPDPFEALQWHLAAPSVGHVGINAGPWSAVHTGRAIRVGIVDASCDAETAVLRGKPGHDRLLAAALTEDAVIDLRPGALSQIAGRNLRTESGPLVDDATGGRGGDRLVGNWLANRLDGGPGDDRLSGGGGDDRLIGGEGRDTLIGGGGHDTLYGGPGDDRMTGGAGRDTFIFTQPGFGNDVVTDFQLGVDRLDIADLGVALAHLNVRQAGSAAIVEIDGSSIRLAGVSAAALLAQIDEVFLA